MAQNSRGEFLFDKHCDTILSMFAKKWVPTTTRVAYETHFSLKNWKALSASEKEEHTLSSCVACSRNSKDLQKAFPGKPIYEAQSYVNLTLPENVSISSKREKQEARIVLGKLNNAWENRYAHTLTSIIPSMVPQHNLVPKKTKIETKQRDRNIKKKISAHITHQLGENATMTLLAEGESLS